MLNRLRAAWRCLTGRPVVYGATLTHLGVYVDSNIPSDTLVTGNTVIVS